MIFALKKHQTNVMIIAIDGPAASGKGTLARNIARVLGLHYLDTGKLYRAVARDLLQAGKTPDDVEAGVAAAMSLDPDSLSDPALNSSLIGQAASIVSAIPKVRDALLRFQRDFAHKKPGAVLDGRDIGTVVCPEAHVKLFITADLEARARRRHTELLARGEALTLDKTRADLAERDERDKSRSIAPMRPAEDAYLLDTTDLDIETAFQTANDVIRRATGG